MSQIYDISPLLSPKTAVWPGDVKFSQTFSCRMNEGDIIDLSSVQMTVHIGAHCDAPSHYSPSGESIETRELKYYYGDVQVIRVSIPKGARIYPKDLSTPPIAPRILFATGSMPDPNHYNLDFNSLSPELIELLAKQGVILVGIDTPSIDPATSQSLESHQAIAKYNMAIIEGVVLEHVPEGLYTLSAFPLKMEGADASPVRAVLIKP